MELQETVKKEVTLANGSRQLVPYVGLLDSSRTVSALLEP
jgi:hypothetical protein